MHLQSVLVQTASVASCFCAAKCRPWSVSLCIPICKLVFTHLPCVASMSRCITYALTVTHPAFMMMSQHFLTLDCIHVEMHHLCTHCFASCFHDDDSTFSDFRLHHEQGLQQMHGCTVSACRLLALNTVLLFAGWRGSRLACKRCSIKQRFLSAIRHSL